jgi:hypothetical protein
MTPKTTVVAELFHVTKLLNNKLGEQQKTEKRTASENIKRLRRLDMKGGFLEASMCFLLTKNKKNWNKRQRESLIEAD